MTNNRKPEKREFKFSEEFKSERKKLTVVLQQTKNEAIKNIATNLVESLMDIQIMTRLPELMLLHSIAHSESLIEGLQICSKISKNDTDDMVLNELRTKLVKVPINREIIENRYKQLASWGGVIWADLEVERILRMHEQHKRSYSTLLYSVVVWLWTLFEVAAETLWETMLNVGFETLGRKALHQMSRSDIWPHEDKMSGKYIRLDYLAEFDFNIREQSGSILKRYFDFTSLQGIQKAYKFLFPKSTILEKAFNGKTLILLAADRNLIVHKAGFIDTKYKKLTNTPQELGEKLFIDGEKLDPYHITILRVFRIMLNCANRYLSLEKIL